MDTTVAQNDSPRVASSPATPASQLAPSASMYPAFLSGCTLWFAILGGISIAAAAEAPVLSEVPASSASAPAEQDRPGRGVPPSQGFRPIGSPSAVDAFAPPSSQTPPASQAAPDFAGGSGGGRPDGLSRTETSWGAAQAAYMQGGGFEVPPAGSASPYPMPADSGIPRTAPPVTGNGFGSPPTGNSLEAPPLNGGNSGGYQVQPNPAPAGPSSGPAAPSLPPGLQPVPSTAAPLTAPPPRSSRPFPMTVSPSDAAPVPEPRLGSTWATEDNCNLVSGPSGYRAEFGDCVPGAVVPMSYTAPPAVVVPPTIMPGVAPPAPLILASAGHRPLFTLGQENYNVQLGQGIIGQPTVYVPGQYFRNFLRYISP